MSGGSRCCFNPAAATYAEYWLNPFKAAAVSFAVEAIAAPVRDKSDLESVIAALAREPHGGLTVMPDSFTDAHPREITSLAARYRLPAVYAYRLPRFVIPPSRVFPPVEFCRGTRPSQAPNSRPERNTFGSATVVAIAVAMIGPMPGMLASR